MDRFCYLFVWCLPVFVNVNTEHRFCGAIKMLKTTVFFTFKDAEMLYSEMCDRKFCLNFWSYVFVLNEEGQFYLHYRLLSCPVVVISGSHFGRRKLKNNFTITPLFPFCFLPSTFYPHLGLDTFSIYVHVCFLLSTLYPHVFYPFSPPLLAFYRLLFTLISGWLLFFTVFFYFFLQIQKTPDISFHKGELGAPLNSDALLIIRYANFKKARCFGSQRRHTSSLSFGMQFLKRHGALAAKGGESC